MKYDMVDLKGQYEKIKDDVDREIREVLDTTRYIGGPKVDGFAEALADYHGVKEVIPCGNGTDSLQIALMAFDLKEGEEIITSPFTFISTAEVIALLKLKPVFVDIDLHTFNLDVDQIESAITSRTRAIIPVHLFGQPCDMEPIMDIANKHGIYVLEDNAQAIGANYTFSSGTTMKAGAIGHVGSTSFFPSKNLGCYGDGGALTTNDEDLALKMRQIANHGSPKRYYHDFVGVNSRLDAIQAAVLNVKLKHLDEYIKARQDAANIYNDMLAEVDWIKTPTTKEFCSHVFHQYTLKILGVERDKVKAHLDEHGIANSVYYPIPLHLQKAYRNYGYQEGDFPISERSSREVISLPMHTELTREMQSEIVDILKKAI
jgi:dTDP-4-amino-4,6-dideoxygalactose transaminase